MSLAPLFHPRGVAFVGATPDLQKYNGRVLQYCLQEGFKGGIYAVNPKYQTIFDVPCYPDLAAIPGPVDVVVVLVGPSRVPDLLDQCRAKGVKFAIALGDLVAPDAPDKAARLSALRHQIVAGGPRIVGPVCVGVAAPHENLAMTMSSGVLAGPLPRGGIGFITQSGGVMSSVLDRAHQFGAGFSALISSGAEFDLDLCDYIEHLIDDRETRCISVYAEKILDAPRLFRLAGRALEAGKPILMLKSGRSALGARAALTHSGAIASDRDIEDAAFRRHGIVRVSDIDDLHMTAELLCRTRVEPDKGVAAVSQSGGYCAIVADTLSDAGVPLAEPRPETVRRILTETPVPRVGNPHDSASGPPGNNAPHSRAALLAFQDDANVGLTLYAETMYMYQDQGFKLQSDVARGKKPHVVCWQGGRSTEPVIAALRRDGLIVFDGLRAAAAALAALYRYARLRRERVSSADLAHGKDQLPVSVSADGGLLSDGRAKPMLRSFGVPLVPEHVVNTAEDACAAAATIGFPVVVKGLDATIAHKSDVGLVALSLTSEAAVKAACLDMAERRGKPLQGYLVQPMVAGGIEFAIGVKSDPAIGPAVLLGLGGIFIEAYGSPVVELAPIDQRVAQAMIAAVDRKGILDGYRTGRKLDKAGLANALVSVGRMAWALRDRVESIDLNPVIVSSNATFVVDAVVSLHPARGGGDSAHQTALEAQRVT
jgi:acyl-CoA synthetase (NDP forming)